MSGSILTHFTDSRRDSLKQAGIEMIMALSQLDLNNQKRMAAMGGVADFLAMLAEEEHLNSAWHSFTEEK